MCGIWQAESDIYMEEQRSNLSQDTHKGKE